MKRRFPVLTLVHLICGGVFVQAAYAEGKIFPLLKMEAQNSLIVTADEHHQKDCPQEYTNLISNTNLISPAERAQLEKVVLKYKNVTSNSGPPGGVFFRYERRRWGHEELTGPMDPFQVATYNYPNMAAHEDIRYKPGSTIEARFRTQDGDGYDVVLVNGSITFYEEYKRWALDGLFLGWHDPNRPDQDPHFGLWTRFSKGKAVGKFIGWRCSVNDGGRIESKIILEAEFKEPFDFLKYESVPIDLAWTEVSTNSPNSIQNPPK